MMRIDVVTLFPEMFEPMIANSIIGRARAAGHLDIRCHQLRDYTLDKHFRTDFPPASGGKGMLLYAQPIHTCYEAIVQQQNGKKPHVIYPSPGGKLLTQARAVEISRLDSICIICGHYEGIDQRVIDEIVDEELSIGDYVLTGGELPSLVIMEAVARLCKGVLANELCWQDESHSNGLLEYPQYTKPNTWREKEIPPVLLSGHNANIVKWQREKSLEKTLKMRPDLLEKAELTAKDREYLQFLRDKEENE